MVGFSSRLGVIYDMFSLYLNAPYNDTSINIKGSFDLSFLASASLYTNDKERYYVQGGFYRPFETSDTFGDENIRKKMSLTYCYAASHIEDLSINN
jgi:hypothetical protein